MCGQGQLHAARYCEASVVCACAERERETDRKREWSGAVLLTWLADASKMQ